LHLRRLLFIVSLLLSGCGEHAEREYKPYNLPIYNGDPDTNPDHMAVVGVYDNYQFCSGTLLTSTVVLTAAHCISNRSFYVLFGNNVNTATSRSVSEKRVHPAWDSNNLVNDVALLRLASSAPAGTPTIPYLPGRLGITRRTSAIPWSSWGTARRKPAGSA
jgi:hypothetical protein